MQTKEQIRAQFALTEIGVTFGNQIDKDTSNYLNGVPSMILMNGLGQSLAFLLAKAEGNVNTKYGKTFTSLKKWLSTDMISLSTTNNREFLTKVTELDMSTYVMVQREALAYLNWLKRYARALKN